MRQKNYASKKMGGIGKLKSLWTNGLSTLVDVVGSMRMRRAGTLAGRVVLLSAGRLKRR